MTLTQFLDRLKELDEKATPRPWQTEGGLDQYVFSSNNEIMLAEMRGIGAGLTDEQRTQNAQLITELRNALPAILEVIRIQRDALEKVSWGGVSQGQLSNSTERMVAMAEVATEASHRCEQVIQEGMK